VTHIQAPTVTIGERTGKRRELKAREEAEETGAKTAGEVKRIRAAHERELAEYTAHLARGRGAQRERLQRRLEAKVGHATSRHVVATSSPRRRHVVATSLTPALPLESKRAAKALALESRQQGEVREARQGLERRSAAVEDARLRRAEESVIEATLASGAVPEARVGEAIELILEKVSHATSLPRRRHVIATSSPRH